MEWKYLASQLHRVSQINLFKKSVSSPVSSSVQQCPRSFLSSVTAPCPWLRTGLQFMAHWYRQPCDNLQPNLRHGGQTEKPKGKESHFASTHPVVAELVVIN